MNKPKKIIWLTTMPRSGSTWVSQIFAASSSVKVKFCPLFSYTFKNKMSKKSTPQEWVEFFNKVFITSDEYMDQRHLTTKGLIPENIHNDHNQEILLIKSNRQHHLTESILKKLPNIQFVAIVRNPLSVINSWITNQTEFPANEDPLLQWRSGECRKKNNPVGEFWGFDDWIKVTQMHIQLAEKYPDRFNIYRYEDILASPFSMARTIFNTLDIDFSDEVKEFISLSRAKHSDNPRSVYKSKIDPNRWKKQLPPVIVNEIYNDIKGTSLERFLKE